jgi:hypothetical protein
MTEYTIVPIMIEGANALGAFYYVGKCPKLAMAYLLMFCVIAVLLAAGY